MSSVSFIQSVSDSTSLVTCKVVAACSRVGKIAWPVGLIVAREIGCLSDAGLG